MSWSRGAAAAATLVTATGRLPARGSTLAASVTPEAGIAWVDGVIDYVGPADGLPWEPTVGDPARGSIACN